MPSPINIVWFKKDLRLSDHAPLHFATFSEKPTLLLFCFEPLLQKSPDWDFRHWWFMYHSITEMNQSLQPLGHQVYFFYNEVLTVLDELQKNYIIDTIFSHQETGIKLTYDRDKRVKRYYKNRNIKWQEFQTGGVIRGLKDRDAWAENWANTMAMPEFEVDMRKITPFHLPKMQYFKLQRSQLPLLVTSKNIHFQKAGEKNANHYLQTFLEERSQFYLQNISKPEQSSTFCSRISPYLTYGNISMRRVYQTARNFFYTAQDKRNINAFISRLSWHCHFIQKFEMEERIEFENQNRAFDDIRNEWSSAKFDAWKKGKTGFPLVDAAMRCVTETGYINFRMRAMLVSFLTHHLWLHWRDGAVFLAKQFLDFEPGIHYAQFQMQAGTTGVNTIRIYNPVKQSKELDEGAVFIKKWLPELKNIPPTLCHEPWNITPMEQMMYNFTLGKDYPHPIVDLKKSHKLASDTLWQLKKTEKAKMEKVRILRRHVQSPK